MVFGGHTRTIQSEVRPRCETHAVSLESAEAAVGKVAFN